MPVGVPTRYDFGIVDLHFYLGIAGEGRVKAVEKEISMETVSCWHNALELELQISVAVDLGMHLIAPQ